MSSNIFIRLSYEDVLASLMENVRMLTHNYPVVESLLCANELIEDFATYVTEHGIHDFGVIQMSLIKDANCKPTHIFISGIDRYNLPKSVQEWRNFLQGTLKYHWDSFWPGYLQKRYTSLLEMDIYAETEKELLSCLSFMSWIRSLITKRSSRSPSKEDFEVIQTDDLRVLSMVGSLSWLLQTKSVGFKWVEADETMRRGTFYRHIHEQLKAIRIRMSKVDPSYFDKTFAMVILVEALKRLGVSKYDTKGFVAKVSNSAKLNEIVEKMAKDSGLAALKDYSDALKDSNGLNEPIVVHSTKPVQFFVDEMKPVTSWFHI